METEFITLSGKEIKPCDVCRSCRQTGKCHINDDLPSILEKMLAVAPLAFHSGFFREKNTILALFLVPFLQVPVRPPDDKSA